MLVSGLLLLAGLPEPPPMPHRTIFDRGPQPGWTHTIEIEGQRVIAFLPGSWRPRGRTDVTIHFHGASWHAIQEHLDRGLREPLFVADLGQGSSVYASPFRDPSAWPKWRAAMAAHLTSFAKMDVEIGRVAITSFSAGYGAVREIVRTPANLIGIRRILLLDSLYGSLDPAAAERIPLREHLEVWRPAMEAAMQGKLTFCITVSEVPTPTYASSLECAQGLVAMVGAHFTPVGDSAAARDVRFPLKSRFDSGRLSVWAYGGSDAQAHMTHARHIASVWRALDRAKAP